MNIDHLVKMTNQIGAFFESMPNRQQAQADAAAHVHKSWDPRMRRELLQYIDEHPQSGVSAFMLEALQAHREELA